MKLSKKALLIVAIVIFVVANGVLFSIYYGQVRELNQLHGELDTYQTDLKDLIDTKIPDKQDELAQAESLLEEKEAQFPDVVESIEYGEDFFKIAYGKNLHTMAAGCGVDLDSLTASGPNKKKAGPVTYSVVSFKVKVSGPLDNILKFIDAIGTGIDYAPAWSFQLPWSVDVSSVNIGVDGTTNIQLDIYGYKR